MRSRDDAFDTQLKQSLMFGYQSNSANATDADMALISDLMMRMRLARQFYLDDEAAGDGGHAIMLAMFHDLARGEFTTVTRLIESVDTPLSTAVYIINVLENAGHIRRVDGPKPEDASYTLSPWAERAMRGFLSVSADMIKMTCKALG